MGVASATMALCNGDCSLMQGEVAARRDAEVGVGCGSAASRAAVGGGICRPCVLDRPGGVCAEPVLVPVAEWRIVEGDRAGGLPVLAAARACASGPASIRAGPHLVAAALIALRTGWHRRPILLGPAHAARVLRNHGGHSWDLCH